MKRFFASLDLLGFWYWLRTGNYRIKAVTTIVDMRERDEGS